MARFIFITGIFFTSVTGFSFEPSDSLKTEENKNKHPLKTFYGVTGGELIFGLGDQQADSLQFTNKLRFSFFPHVQQQYHYNFHKNAGFYTGMNFINVGFRHQIQQADSSIFQLRQRSLSFGVPLALKLGNMERGNFVAFGACAELMYHYKYKIYYGDTKEKYRDWFSDRVNLLNYALFVDFRNKTGGFIRLKYYLNDFLAPVSSTFIIPVTGESVTFAPTRSSIFYVSFGSTFMVKKNRKLTKEDV